MDKKPTAELIARLKAKVKQEDDGIWYGGIYPEEHREIVKALETQQDRLAELEAALTWQPIDTAPKDGSIFECLIDGVVYASRYDELGRFLWLSHADMGTGESYLIHKVDGKELKEQLGHHKEEWRKTWHIWVRGFDFSPTHWRPMWPKPQTLQPKEADNE